ncbi:Mucosa-associated lymphoid tissue lymphoma translocation protein 1 [Bagarius yarrelli]|uniref:Mucosa-associated lymphoid tissue lymphoma translocation protein 1 n=1 Tax=Bagarius yarrelli TaxID=175774 RepID=A0A556U5D7_BAGYA|nr:Mucosa-associated lymphoid tissue lymphoma translocation protein 1 [Bagarius yarrelli]
MSQESYDSFLNINLLKESVLKRLAEALDKANSKGWRKLGETVNTDRRFKVSLGNIHMCSLKVLEAEGSPSRSLLRLMGDQGCTVADLMEFLKMMGHQEALQCFKSGIEILIQPQSVAVLVGHTVRLSCYAAATSSSTMQYQWFKAKEEIPGGSSSDLVLSPVQLTDAGFYICRVNCQDSFEFSHWVQVDVLDVTPTYGLMSIPSEGRLRVVIQPKPQSLLVGDALNLECGAVGKPLPVYQWYKNGAPLKNATKRKLNILYLLLEHQGRYRCEISCNNEHTWSNEVDILVDESLEKPYATDKVALLIGNMSYQNHPQLKAPMVDVYDLTNLIRQLNFKVVSLLDLTESEMRNAVDEFLSLLHKGVYGTAVVSWAKPKSGFSALRYSGTLKINTMVYFTGLLYYAGHGNVHDWDTPNVMLKVTANIVFGYATCQDAEAFELSSSGFTNGVFIKFLKERLLEDEKITVLLDSVAEDMGQFDPTKGKQALEIRSSLSERRSLTDPILPGECSDLVQAHSLLWAKANELPESMTLDFDCGVQIKMGFAAEFSNVLVIYTDIVKKPEEMSLCQAHLINLSDLDPKMMNKETPEETGSYLLSESLPQHCLYTRLGSLQKLKENLAFTVCLQAEFTSLDEQVQWKKEVDIGKPLIAKLDLHRPTRRNSCQQTCLMPHSPSSSPSLSQGAGQLLFPCHHPQSSSSLLHVCEPVRTAAEVYKDSLQNDYNHRYDNNFYSPYMHLPSVPIETTEDIEDMQNKFMDSLHLYS